MPFIIGLVVRGATAFLTRLLVTLASEQMIAWAFFKVAESVVKSTKTARTTKPLKYSGNPRKTAIRHQWDGWPLVMKMGMEQKETGKWRNSG